VYVTRQIFEDMLDRKGLQKVLRNNRANPATLPEGYAEDCITSVIYRGSG
jgi:hypothetical protein